LLLGHQGGAATIIADFYRVKDEPLGAWLQRAQARGLKQSCGRSADSLDVVGLLRAQAVEKIALSPDDRNLMAKFFPGPLDIVMLVRTPAGGDPPTAGFFFWDAGEIFTDFCLLEFPLDVSLLKARAARRETSARVQPAAAAANYPDSSPNPGKPGVPRRTRRGRYALAFIAVVSVTAAAWFYKRSAPAPPPPAPKQAAIATERLTQAASAMGFQVEARTTDLYIKWDRASEAVQKARIGLLTIADGALKREVPLTPAQLQSGSVAYTPVNSSIELRLEVFSETGHRITEEALAIWTRGGSRYVTVAREQQSSPADPPSRQEIKTFVPPPSGSPPAPSIPEAPPVISTIAGPPVAISNALRLPRARLAAPLPPPVAATRSVGPPQVNQAPLSQSAPAPTVAAAPVQTVPARPVRRVQPLLAPNIRALLRGNVEVSVRLLVDVRGQVVSAEPVASPDGMPRVLIPPAVAAARQWQFEPARTPGGPVPSEFIVKFQFSGSR
jgi:hypothetical protein